MMDFNIVLNLFKDLFINVGTFWGWFTTPLFDLNGITFTPIGLFSIGGIIIFIGVAITLWIIK